MMGKPGFEMCINSAVVLPDFITFARPARIALARKVNGISIIYSLNLVDGQNMAGVVDKEDAKRLHLASRRRAFPKTLIWLNRQKTE